MAFQRQFLSRIGGSGNSKSIWMYASFDPVATVLGDDYFVEAITEIQVGDCMFIVDRLEASPELAEVAISFCKQNNGVGIIRLASGTAIGNT